MKQGSGVVITVLIIQAFSLACSDDSVPERRAWGGTSVPVQSEPVRAGASMAVAEVASWEVGGADRENFIDRTSDALLVSDSLLAVASARNGTLDLFRTEGGAPVARVSTGQGPAEILEPTTLIRGQGGRLHAYDRGNRRAVVVDGYGMLTTAWPVGNGLFSTLWPVGALDREEPRFLSVAFQRPAPEPGVAGPVWVPSEVMASQGRGDPETILRVPEGREIYTTETGGFITSPVLREAGIVPLLDGFWLVDGSESKATRFDPSARMVVATAWDTASLSLSDSEGRRAAQVVIESLAEVPVRAEREFEIMGNPEHVPALESVHADPFGLLWVVRRDYTDGSRFADVIGRDGAWLERVNLPSAGDVMDVGESWVLILRTDDLGIESLRGHALSGRARR